MQHVSRIMKENVRESDLVARLGGDEFLLIFPETNKNKAESVWKRISDKFDEINEKMNLPCRVSVSHGVVDCNSRCDISAEDLISKADEIMYREKEKLKNGEMTDG